MLAQLRALASRFTRTQLLLAASALALALLAGAIVLALRPELPRTSDPLEARMELAAGEVTVAHGGRPARVNSGAVVLAGSRIAAGAGARALLRLSDGSALFLRGGSEVELFADAVRLDRGEAWFEASAGEGKGSTLRIGELAATAAESGLSVRRDEKEASLYVARGLVHLSGPSGRAEVHAGERAVAGVDSKLEVKPVAYWEDWTGGMADQRMTAGAAGAGRIYGVDPGAAPGRPALPLEIAREAVRARLRSGLAETEVDQTFYNPGERDLEGWYWLTVPENALVTGFAVENQGTLVEGELIERREAAQHYRNAAAAGYQPALLEWVDGRSFRARITPVPARGSRRVVTRYLELTPLVDGRLRYLFPLRSEPPVRMGEFSLMVDVGKAGREMQLSTLEDSRIEAGGERVTLRRSGFAPSADFVLEARLPRLPPPVRVARMESGPESADTLMLRYVPDMEWENARPPPGAVVVVVDTSAGTDETTRQLESAAAESILRALSDTDRFALMTLDVRPEVLYPEQGLAPASEAEVSRARERLSAHPPGGATDLGALFDVALSRLQGAEQPALIYIGDGVPSSGEIAGERLQAALRRSLQSSPARFFAVAVGGEANLGLLDALARAGGGRSLRVGSAEEAGIRALELVGALKTPTVTDFVLDAGAGLDQPFWSADGKVSWGSEIVLLARSHHDLPRVVKVRGRLGGKPFEKSYAVHEEDAPIAALAPRLWAAASMRKLLGEGASPDEQRGTIAKLGIDYGLMTPFTSFLALESEAAYAAQGIPRHARGALAQTLGAEAPQGSADPSGAVAQNAARYAFKDAREERAAGGYKSAPAAPVPDTTGRSAPSTIPQESVREDEEPSEFLSPPAAPAPSAPRGSAMPAAKAGGAVAYASRPQDTGRPGALALHAAGCSDASQRPLYERALLWERRLKTAAAPEELAERYGAAAAACELPDWRAESLFLRLLADRIGHESQAAEVFAALASRPQARFYLARVLLRRSAEGPLAAAVEKLLFGDRVAWDKVDLELSALADLQVRLTRLRQIASRAPDDPAGGLRLMELLARAGRTDEALLLARRWREGGLLTPRLTLAMGDLLADSGQAGEAIRVYSEIVEFDSRNLAARRILGDAYLARGWYDLAYGQYQTLTEAAPEELSFQLRLAQAAAGAGRVDEALRLERKVARAAGAPGPSDPRQWARLISAGRLASLIEKPGQGEEAERRARAMRRDLAELQLFPAPGTLVLLTWEDRSADLGLVSRAGKDGAPVGEIFDGSAVGLSAVLAPADRAQELALKARIRSAPPRRPLKMRLELIRFDGKSWEVSSKTAVLPAGQAEVTL